ncbi:DUF1499 domain-containing protein [Kordiimonas sp. SCSIO 12603]|uniref:DUF1499 domain-containing protein n=1 Tax=Kordiimonas sp. SCSIO 12603 TaxID=2829596 RepID=UPI00210722E2|nr:DUF1499 domain-containing protein [Kordiimonas sp. SCSIO 12603]UTW57851.1 DUF1499 domain-containing protein [Kordiimonas sp. SCSIO 12603]
MSRIFFKKAGQKPSIFSTLGLILMIMTILVFVSAGPILGVWQNDSMSPNDFFDLRIKLLDLDQKLLIAGSFLTFFGILHGRFSSRVRTSWRGISAALLAVTVAATMWQVDQSIRKSPILHDITTDISDPPFFTTLAERIYESNSPEDFVGSRLSANYAQLHTSAYPYIQPVISPLDKSGLFDKAQLAVKKCGWDIAALNAQTGHLEAVYTSPWFRLKSNVVIRVREDAAGSKLDIRATSALGLSDFGINAALIEEFKEALNKEIS